MSSTNQLVTPQQLRTWLLGHEELALLDVSEARHHAQGHIVAAKHVPLSLLELQAPHLLPRRSVRIVLTSSNPDEQAAQWQVQRAAGLLSGWGYSNVLVLDGGLPAWRESGGILIDGYASLVKAFGEEVRLHHGVPAISPKALAERVQSGKPTTIVDVRTTPEHRYSTLPGALNYPGVEWPLRDISASSASDDHLWAVTCFSRTRGVIGTATLRALHGKDAPAAWVDDGVMAWVVDGDADLRNAPAPADVLPELPEAEARTHAQQLLDRHALPTVDAKTFQAWQADNSRTLLVFDLRPGAVSRDGITAIAGGQLLMHFEVHAVVRNARVVLLDEPHRLRAAVTSFWLHQLGEAEVFIYDGLADEVSLKLGSPAVHARDEWTQPITAQALANLVESQQVVVLDVGPSIDFLRAHVPQSHYANASEIDVARQLYAQALRDGKRFVVTSPDGSQARLVARDVIAESAAQASAEQAPLWLEGGVQAWQAQGLLTESGIEQGAQPAQFLDDWGSIMRVADADRIPVWERYLQWERTLAPRIQNDPGVRFRFFA